MHNIEMHEVSGEFARCWQAAGQHVEKQVQGPIRSWLKATLDPPFLEHLSFRLGNQLFFIRLEDADQRLEVPGTRQGLMAIARGCKGVACLMPMHRKGNSWQPSLPSWGLIDVETRKPVDPVALVTEEKIEMTPWELHDMAVQVVRDYLKKEGFQLMSAQGNPAVDPSIWFVGKSEKPEWVVVRSAKFPVNSAERPRNWAAIAENCARMSANGHFASVVVVSVDQPFQSSVEAPLPLWRGYGMHVRFIGLE